jgi:demethylmenaquinone methyltransferase / 2-methoxy-6-polyprenyl-1,4-benzoquinol methylase
VTSVLPLAADKPRYVAAMFARIARRYDLMNTLITFGQDGRWRRSVASALASHISASAPTRAGASVVLDVGTGTGRLAQAILDRDPTLVVVAVDLTLRMLQQAPRHFPLTNGDAVMLPFADAQFDAVASGFLVRNLADVEHGIAEQIRVLRPGGVLVILETTPGPGGLLGFLYRLYFRKVVPVLGGLIAGDASAYTYLPASTLAFLEPERLARLLVEHGVEDVRIRRLALGSVAVTQGRKRLDS